MPFERINNGMECPEGMSEPIEICPDCYEDVRECVCDPTEDVCIVCGEYGDDCVCDGGDDE